MKINRENALGIKGQANCFGFWTADRAVEASLSMAARTGKNDRKTYVLDCLGAGSGRFVVRSSVFVDIEGEIGQ